MAEKEDKIILEREYIIPLRKKCVGTQKYRRVPKAIKELKRFIARNMQVRDEEMKKVKIDRYLNEEIWFRGIRKPPAKIKVKAKKFESGIVKVELAEIPEKVKWKIEKDKKLKEIKVKKEEKKEEKVEEKKLEEKPEEKAEEKEKIEAEREAGKIIAEEKAREIKHETKMKKQLKHQFRKALQK